MKFSNGLWHYQGQAYATLREALLAAWMPGRGGGGMSMKRTLIDLLLLLAGIALVLLAFLSLLSMESAEQEAETAATEPTASPDTDAMVLAVPELTAMPEPTSIPDPDKPAYNPAIPLSEDLQCILWAACEENNVDPAIALGLIEVESGFDPYADNGLCYGLMQLSRRYFPDNLPSGENIQYGVEYLGQLLARYDNVGSALCAYNAGHDIGSLGYANAVLAAAEKWRDLA